MGVTRQYQLIEDLLGAQAIDFMASSSSSSSSILTTMSRTTTLLPAADDVHADDAKEQECQRALDSVPVLHVPSGKRNDCRFSMRLPFLWSP
jgi:hypothetical protein